MTEQQPTTLLERTRDMLSRSPKALTYTAMSKATGVSVAWISRFADDKIPNPGVNQVQALHDFLAKREA